MVCFQKSKYIAMHEKSDLIRTFVFNALMDVYARCEVIESSMVLFLEAPNGNDVTGQNNLVMETFVLCNGKQW
ncbi:hypothetical protein Droror1_Dr00027703, partial [Drosera rotundifolia]